MNSFLIEAPLGGLQISMMLTQVMLTIGIFLWAAVYILRGISYYKLAKSRSLSNPWMSWIPFAREYQIGHISDDISAKNHIKKSRGPLLLVLSIVQAVLGIAAVVMYLMFLGNVIFNASATGIYEYTYTNEEALELLIPVLIGFGFMLLSCAVGVWNFVVFCMAHYNIYKDYSSTHVTSFTVLTVITFLFGITILPPIFVLTLLNKPSLSANGGSDSDQAYG